MNTGEVLRAAAARVRKGWCQDQYFDGGNGVCAIGALCVIGGIGLYGNQSRNNEIAAVDQGEAAKWLAMAIGHGDGDQIVRHACIPIWNDAEGQTAENVAAGLELAALLSEQEQQQAQPEPRLVVESVVA